MKYIICWQKKTACQIFTGLWLVIWFAVGCQFTSTTSPEPIFQTPSVEVTRLVITTEPSPTPTACTPLPKGMTLQVEPISSNEVSVGLTGLQPGEKLVFNFAFVGELTGQRTREIESRPIDEVGEDGVFTIEETLNPLPESKTNSWIVKVVHARGVACMNVTLPNE